MCVFCRGYVEMLQWVKELCCYLPSLEGETRSRCCSQVVICASLVLFRSAYLYVSAVQPALFHGQSLPRVFICICIHMTVKLSILSFERWSCGDSV